MPIICSTSIFDCRLYLYGEETKQWKDMGANDALSHCRTSVRQMPQNVRQDKTFLTQEILGNMTIHMHSKVFDKVTVTSKT